MRKLTMAIVLALIVASCGGSDEPVSSEADSPITTETSQVADTEATAASGDSVADTTAAETPTTDAEPAQAPDGPPAPDFELALADGSSFALSAAEKPVYMVFWAEW